MNIKKYGVGVIIALVTLFAVDRFLNVTRITPPILKYYNEEYGALNVPNIKYLKSREGFFLGETNYDGRFRENYPKRKTDSNTLRIILVGDSFVEGIDVLARNHFAAYMERLISAQLNRKVEVLDFGRGNCTLQPSSYYYLNYIKKEYDIDLVLFFTEARDLQPVADYPSTAFVYDSTVDNLVVSKSWKESQEFKAVTKMESLGLLGVLNNSGLFRLAYRARSGISMYGFLPKVLGKFYGERATQTYERMETKQELSRTSAHIFDTLSKQTDPPVWFVLRNFPLESRQLEDFMGSMHYNFFDLKDTLDFKIIRNTKDDAYYFKTTNLYGGHWNHLGHKAVGYFLSNKLVQGIKSGNIKIDRLHYGK